MQSELAKLFFFCKCKSTASSSVKLKIRIRDRGKSNLALPKGEKMARMSVSLVLKASEAS